MHKKITVGILVIGSLVAAVSLLTPVAVDKENNLQDSTMQGHDTPQFLPWQIEPTAGGSIRVFGLTLGESTLQQAEDQFKGGAKVSLFVSPDGKYKVEAFFDKVMLGGFGSQLVMVMALSQEQQAAMFERGTRVSNPGGGRKKVTLAGDDLKLIFRTPVESITYLTRARLDDELLRKRFGEPAQRIREADNNATHWLYPSLGLDAVLNDEGLAVLQYVAPQQFESLTAPLRESRPLP